MSAFDVQGGLRSAFDRARRRIPEDFRFRIPDRFRDRIPDLELLPLGPSIADVVPLAGPAGTRVTIRGARFGARAQDNEVQVGGARAVVLSSSPSRLEVLTGPGTVSGPVAVRVGARTATAPAPFTAAPGGTADAGPPIVFEGRGSGAMAGAPTSGTLRVLVSLVRAADQTVADPTGARNDVIDSWSEVTTFYDQASYGDLDVVVDVTTSWAALSGDASMYLDPSIDNIAEDELDRFVAEAAQAAVDDGKDLDDYDVMAATIFLDGDFIRAWGGWSRSNFSDDDTGINLTADSPIALIAIQETADWGRCAHELGHALVDAPGFTGDDTSALGEDVYASDLVDSGTATAARFEMMGSHDSHPLFSGYNMEQLGWYDGGNIAELAWDRNPTTRTLELVAHGTSENTDASRFHLARIDVAPGLAYYLQVRQGPGSTGQVFDDSIPTGGATDDGGLVVTTVLSETVNNNQQMRFITLLHDVDVLEQGETATDPARGLVVRVDDVVQSRPMVCRVTIEWAQSLTPDPDGGLDLRITPWGSGYQTPDIWVDRQPYGSFDAPTDSSGRPEGNGDKPRPGEINKFWARVSNNGIDDANDVKVTFYSVEPPGVGDNGNWAPIRTETLSTLGAGSFDDVAVNWVPLVGRHTCLRVFIGEQLGEVAHGNNSAQENVFEFEAAAASVPAAVTTPFAVRNPLDEEAVVLLSIDGVPQGWTVGLSQSWVRLGPRAERTVEFSAVPTLDYLLYLRGEVPREARIRITGYIPRTYTEPAISSHMVPIGGVMAVVRPKQRVNIRITAEPEGDDAIVVIGRLVPGLAGERVRVDLRRPDGELLATRVDTIGEGHFRAVLRLEDGLSGRHRVVARTIDSPNAAEAESPPVFVDVGRVVVLPDIIWPPVGGGGSGGVVLGP
jgi:M6 family metalloprotease-like protein